MAIRVHTIKNRRLLATALGFLVGCSGYAFAQTQPVSKPSSAHSTALPSSTELKPGDKATAEPKESARQPEMSEATKATETPDRQDPEAKSTGKAKGLDKFDKSEKTPQAIEPFIKADAIAIGKWLVAQKLEDLSTNKAGLNADRAKPSNATDGKATASKPTTLATANRTQAATQSRSATVRPTPEQRRAAVSAPAPPTPSDRLTIDSALEMRVAVERDVASVAIATSNGGSIIGLDGQPLKSLTSQSAYQAAINGGLTINGEAMPSAVWVQPNGGYVAVGDRWYRGRVLLVLRENGILAVNYVMLREYLYSVVGAEMSPSWSIEALKAQAVAARSYALVHNVRPASRDYDLDDTTRYQAYKGVMTEANTTQAAVQATSGEFISHNGGIVESLYAATQDIVNSAHRGFGMSQTGALDLANQGYQYHQILAYYYPQTAVGRLDIGE